MADNDIEIKVKVDAQGAITVLDKLGNEIQKVDRAAQTGGRGFDGFGGAIVKFNQGLELAQKGLSLLTGAAEKLSALASLGDQVNDVGDAFDAMSLKAGAVGDVFLGKLQEATLGSVNNLELMTLANDAMISGLNPDQFTKVSAAAKQYGDVLKLDTTTAINKLSEAIQAGNERTLKQFGIYSDGKEQVKEYTKAMTAAGQQVDAATIADIKRTAALEALNKKQIEQSAAILGVGDTLDTVKVSYENMIQNVAKSFDKNVELTGALGDVKKAFDSVNGKKFGAELAAMSAAVVSMVATTLPKLISWSANIGAILNNVFGGGLAGMQSKFEVTIQSLKQQISNLETLQNSRGNFFKDYTDDIQKLNDQLKIEETNHRFVTEQINAQKDAEDLAAKTTKELAAAQKELEDETTKAGAAAQVSAEKWDLVTFSLKDTQKQIREMNEIAMRGGQSVIEQIMGVPKSKDDAIDWQDRGMLIATSLLDGFQAAMDSTGKERTKNIIGSLGTTIGAAIGGQQGAGIGNFAANLGISLGEAIHEMFGGDSAGTTARKEADKYFAELFDANRLILVIDGELTKIKDLTFGNGTGMFADGSFDDVFQGLSNSAQAAFGGVGLAFENLLDIGEDAGGQLAAIFANNVGGSLNNLQLLVQATGKSFEDLSAITVQTFLDGQISAVEAQTALLGIAQIAQQGIPDGLGFTVQAFENMKAAGTKGGRAVVDALGDIGAEAKELGIKDFPALIANLEASGKFSADEITKVFEALQANGIKSVDALTNATAEQLIPVLSQLQADGVLTEALEKTADLARQINELPDEKNIVLNVSANVSPAAAGVIAATRAGGSGNGAPYGT